jgi:hypothetical protein
VTTNKLSGLRFSHPAQKIENFMKNIKDVLSLFLITFVFPAIVFAQVSDVERSISTGTTITLFLVIGFLLLRKIIKKK